MRHNDSCKKKTVNCAKHNSLIKTHKIGAYLLGGEPRTGFGELAAILRERGVVCLKENGVAYDESMSLAGLAGLVDRHFAENMAVTARKEHEEVEMMVKTRRTLELSGKRSKGGRRRRGPASGPFLQIHHRSKGRFLCGIRAQAQRGRRELRDRGGAGVGGGSQPVAPVD